MKVFLSPSGTAHALSDTGERTATFACGYTCTGYRFEREWLEMPEDELDCQTCRRATGYVSD